MLAKLAYHPLRCSALGYFHLLPSPVRDSPRTRRGGGYLRLARLASWTAFAQRHAFGDDMAARRARIKPV